MGRFRPPPSESKRKGRSKIGLNSAKIQAQGKSVNISLSETRRPIFQQNIKNYFTNKSGDPKGLIKHQIKSDLKKQRSYKPTFGSQEHCCSNFQAVESPNLTCCKPTEEDPIEFFKNH